MPRLSDLLLSRASLTFLIYVVLGPLLGFIAFREVVGYSRWQDLPLAYLAGGGPAFLCFLAMLRLADAVRHRGMRFILSPVIGAVSGAIGCLPFALWMGGMHLGSGGGGLILFVVIISIVHSVIAAVACTGLIEATGAVFRNTIAARLA